MGMSRGIKIKENEQINTVLMFWCEKQLTNLNTAFHFFKYYFLLY